MDIELFNRIWNLFYSREYEADLWSMGGTIGVTENILDEFGCTYKFPGDSLTRNENIQKLRDYLLDAEWYVIYDFIELYINLLDNDKEKKTIEKSANKIFEEEKAGYRMINGLITPITNSSELEALQASMSTAFDSVNTHFTKALTLYSDRKNPDYENSIKESISAVEAICCIITGITGAQATLGAALKKLENSDVHIHTAMKNAFSSLYGYTSDEDGIRHGGIDFKDAPAEDAKYMLISCSAFVNYLIEKWSKVQK